MMSGSMGFMDRQQQYCSILPSSHVHICTICILEKYLLCSKSQIDIESRHDILSNPYIARNNDTPIKKEWSSQPCIHILIDITFPNIKNKFEQIPTIFKVFWVYFFKFMAIFMFADPVGTMYKHI